jgi:hypothetical protein
MELNRSDLSEYLGDVIKRYAQYIDDPKYLTKEVSNTIDDITHVVQSATMTYGDSNDTTGYYKRNVEKEPTGYLELILKGETNGKENKEN